MARITLVQPNSPISDFSVNGSIISIGGVVIDTQTREADSVVNIEIRNFNGVVKEGGKGSFLAQIEIPPRLYTQEEGPQDPETSLPTIVRTAVPFDPRRVSVTLWPAA